MRSSAGRREIVLIKQDAMGRAVEIFVLVRAQTPEERSRIQVEVAQVYERDLKDDEAAVEGFRQALEFDPANLQALESLEKLYSRLDRPAELLAVYERELENASGDVAEAEIRANFPAELARLAASLKTDANGAVDELTRPEALNLVNIENAVRSFAEDGVLRRLADGRLELTAAAESYVEALSTLLLVDRPA
jgi:tetratricopeptide (TPR) repeat protein